MAQKVDAKFNTESLSTLIMSASQLSQAMEEHYVNVMQSIKNLSDNDTLSGGDGEAIKENMATIGGCFGNMRDSARYCSDALNKILEVVIQMTKGSTLGNSAEQAQAAKHRAGVMKKE